MGELSISQSNKKMGNIASVSLPSVVTCRECDCHKKCYARKLERLRPSVAAAYRRNLDILRNDPDTYWREVEAAVMLSRFFRFHVSGDIPDSTYLVRMVNVARRNQHCQILCFTKKYEIVNEYLSTGGSFPENLHIILSAWVGLEMQNPFCLPEAHVRYTDGTTTARDDAKLCGGNCSECARTDDGCWTLQRGEQVVFNEH